MIGKAVNQLDPGRISAHRSSETRQLSAPRSTAIRARLAAADAAPLIAARPRDHLKASLWVRTLAAKIHLAKTNSVPQKGPMVPADETS